MYLINTTLIIYIKQIIKQYNMKITIDTGHRKIERQNDEALFMDELVDLFVDCLQEVNASNEDIADVLIYKVKKISNKKVLVF